MIIKNVTTKKELEDFIQFPYRLYAPYPMWVPPLLVQQKRLLSRNANPFYRHAEVEHFLAYKSNKVSGRVSAIIDHNHNKFHEENTGFFGFFECIDCRDTAHELLRTAESYLKERNIDTVRGPVNLSTNNECGLLIDGFELPPVVMMTYNPHYYMDFFENGPYKKAMDIYAYIMSREDVDDRIEKLIDYVSIPQGYTFRTIRKKHLRHEISLIKDIYNSAWEKNWGFVPLQDDEFDFLADDLKHIIDEELVFIVEKGNETVGFSLALPDINQILVKMKGRLLPLGFLKLMKGMKKIDTIRVITMGVKKEHRKTGISAMFYLKTIENGLRKGYTRAECSWVLENNRAMNRDLRLLGAHRYKTYRIYEKKI